jgi:serine protease Do
MGYYDDEFQTPKRKRKNSVWFTAFISSIIGGLVVALMLPAISSTGLLPYDVVLKNEGTGLVHDKVATQVDGSSSTVAQQTFQVNVSSEIVDAVEQVSDAIVGVVNIQESADFFARDTRNVERGTGSGVVFEKINGKAYIVTNYHVIEGAKKVEVSLPDGERVEAQLKGGDPLTDLAVLEIDGSHVTTVATFGDSDTIRPGEPAIAIGNPLGLEFSRTVTQGIISAKERSVPVSASWEVNVIQTDAAINPGNSGGALINIKGQVIGINSLKIARQGIEGLGFAIPINDAIPIIRELVEKGEVERPVMGVEILDLIQIEKEHWQKTLKLPESINQGVVVTSVEPLSPADQAGLQDLDVIVAVDGEKIDNSIELRKYLFNKTSIGDTIKVKVYRQGLPVTVDLELSKRMTNPS